MLSTITIGNKEIQLKATSATTIYFQKAFHRDFLREFAKMTKDDEEVTAYELVQQLAFIMAAQVEHTQKELMDGLSELEYVKWLDNFDSDVFLNQDTMTEILGVWNKSTKASVKPKNAISPQ